jgi:hypothetical protein
MFSSDIGVTDVDIRYRRHIKIDDDAHLCSVLSLNKVKSAQEAGIGKQGMLVKEYLIQQQEMLVK